MIYGTTIVRYSSTYIPDRLAFISSVVQSGGTAVTATISMLLFDVKFENFIRVKDLVNHVDRELNKIDIATDYRIFFIVTASFTAWTPSAVVYTCYGSDRPYVTKIYDGLCYVYPFYIRLAYTHILILFLWVISDRYRKINAFVKGMEKNGRNPADLLGKVMELTADLTDAAKLMNETYSVILFLNILNSYTQFLFGIYDLFFASSAGVYSVFELYVATTLLSLQMFVLYLTSFLMEIEVRMWLMLRFSTSLRGYSR